MHEVMDKLKQLKATGYIDKWAQQADFAAKKHGRTLDEVLSSEDPQIIGAWAQTMWEVLPDARLIRTAGFYLLCDIAEWWCDPD